MSLPPSGTPPLNKTTLKIFKLTHHSHQARVYLRIKSGTILSSKISTSDQPNTAASEELAFDAILKGRNVTEIESFWDILSQSSSSVSLGDDVRKISDWLDIMLGKASAEENG